MIRRGTAMHSAKLDEEKVRAIRKADEGCGACGFRPTLRQLADRYGVSTVAVHKILKGRAWKHVDADPA